MSDATRTRENTAIVVDSTADLPDVLLADPNLSMVPLNVHFNDDTFRDWVDIRPASSMPACARPQSCPRPRNHRRAPSSRSTGA